MNINIPAIVRNCIVLSCLSLIESIHLLVLVTMLKYYVSPIKYDPVVWNRYFPFLQSAIRPNYDFFLYHCWLAIAVAVQIALVWIFRKDLEEQTLWGRLRGYVLNEAAFLFILLFCAFKIVVWNSPHWAWVLFYAALIISWGVRIFWPEAVKAQQRLKVLIGRIGLKIWPDAFMAAAIILLIFPTDTESILARIFIQERFHHFNGVIMAPAWSYLSGCILNVDVVCQYGLGMTIAVTKLAQAMGGLSYAHVLWVYVVAVLIYFMAAYALLRYWLGSFLLSAAGIFLAIKFQMFHWGVASLYWIFLSATVVRYFFDMFFLFFILHHIRCRSWGLWLASICAGVSLSYMPDTGAYQWLALCVYLLALGFEQRKLSLIKFALLPLAFAFLILWMLAGPVFWSRAFWQGASELGRLFFNGLGDLPIYTNLQQGQFFAFWMGLIIPLVYVFSMIFAAAQYVLDQKRRESIFMVVVSVYGLGLYHYYICRSALSSYHAVDIPFVFILCYWVREVLSRLRNSLRRAIAGVIFCLSLGALMTNVLFTYYPNIFHLSGYDWSKEKAFYRQQSNVDDDARLVKGLTTSRERVAILSPYEVQILMAAGRKPAFYFFLPLHYPDPQHPDNFAGTVLYTPQRLARTLEDLKKASGYVFVDPAFYRRELPEEIYSKNVALTTLYKFLHSHYEETGQQGRYIMALKRTT